MQGLQNITLSLIGINFNVIELISILLFIGAMGKSAQLGLHTWLPDAMEGLKQLSMQKDKQSLLVL